MRFTSVILGISLVGTFAFGTIDFSGNWSGPGHIQIKGPGYSETGECDDVGYEFEQSSDTFTIRNGYIECDLMEGDLAEVRHFQIIESNLYNEGRKVGEIRNDTLSFTLIYHPMSWTLSIRRDGETLFIVHTGENGSHKEIIESAMTLRPRF